MARIGRRPHRLTLQRPSGVGANDYADVPPQEWGSLRLASSSEALRFGVQASVAAHIVEIPYRADMRGDWRITEPATGRRLQIVGFGDAEDRKRSLTIFCVELQ